MVFWRGCAKFATKVCSTRRPDVRPSLIVFTGINVPIIPGVMPIQTYGSFQRLTHLTGVKVPVHVQEALKPISVHL